MDVIKFGKVVSFLRKQAGYTQKELADKIGISDKAVSKWERGICLPDSAFLPKIAGILDTDFGTLLPNNFNKDEWCGLLILEESETKANTMINGKPLINYLLSYFLLLEITDVTIISNSEDYIKSLHLEQYGFKISFQSSLCKRNTMVVYGKALLFGAYLSHQLLNFIAMEENITPIIGNVTVPFLFAHNIKITATDYKKFLETASTRSLYRGIVCLPLDTLSQIKDVEHFVQIYEKYHGVEYCNLGEISKNRGLTPQTETQPLV